MAGYKVSVYKETIDDWYPNFENDLVSVSIYPENYEGNNWRLCIWGDDDCGLEKLYVTEAAVLTEFMQLIGRESISKDDLIERGFFPA